MQIYFVLKKKIKQSAIRIIGPRPSLSQLYAQLIESHLCYFLKSDFFKVVPEAWVSIFMGEDTASENHPICINMQCHATRFKILGCTGSFTKPESQHRSSSLLCGSSWLSSNCLDRSLLHTLPFLPLQPPIAAASLLLLVFQKEANMALDVQS